MAKCGFNQFVADYGVFSGQYKLMSIIVRSANPETKKLVYHCLLLTVVLGHHIIKIT